MPFRHVLGFCPFGCGETLHLTDLGAITCLPPVGTPRCPNTFAVTDLLLDPETEHVLLVEDRHGDGRPGGWTLKHPLRERLDTSADSGYGSGDLFGCTLAASVHLGDIVYDHGPGRFRVAARPATDRPPVDPVSHSRRAPDWRDLFVVTPLQEVDHDHARS